MERALFTGKHFTQIRAAEVGDIEMVEILLDHDADIDALNYLKQTPFHVVSPSFTSGSDERA